MNHRILPKVNKSKDNSDPNHIQAPKVTKLNPLDLNSVHGYSIEKTIVNTKHFAKKENLKQRIKNKLLVNSNIDILCHDIPRESRWNGSINHKSSYQVVSSRDNSNDVHTKNVIIRSSRDKNRISPQQRPHLKNSDISFKESSESVVINKVSGMDYENIKKAIEKKKDVVELLKYKISPLQELQNAEDTLEGRRKELTTIKAKLKNITLSLNSKHTSKNNTSKSSYCDNEEYSGIKQPRHESFSNDLTKMGYMNSQIERTSSFIDKWNNTKQNNEKLDHT